MDMVMSGPFWADRDVPCAWPLLHPTFAVSDDDGEGE